MNTRTHTDDLITEVDFGHSLENMIAAGRYDWTNSDITAKKFPVIGNGKKKFRNRLFHFNHGTSSEDAVATMERESFAPATHVHGLAFGAAFPNEQRMYPIACLGSSLGRLDRLVVCLDGSGTGRALRLCYWYDGWDGDWRFLGVQEVSDA
jgi:hypothetical protein